jgi:hypothetical protein
MAKGMTWWWLPTALTALAARWLRAADVSSAPIPGLVYERDIRPIRKVHCFHCHGEAGERKGKLDLRLVRLMKQAGQSGAAIVADNPDERFLIEWLRENEMPLGEKTLSAEQKAVVERWVAQGAHTARPEPNDPAAARFTEEGFSFWTFRPVRRLDPPACPGDPRVRTPIDAFLTRQLEEEGLRFAPEADRQTLIRRASFDLTGLPPTPEEIEAFARDEAPDAYEARVDRLLASPRYVERWGRQWLGVAGSSQTDGPRPPASGRLPVPR